MLQLLKGLGVFFKSLWMIIGITLLLILGLELYLVATKPAEDRIKRAMGYAEADRQWAREYQLELREMEVDWRPYNYWRTRPFNGKYIQVDNDGIRRTVNPAPAGGVSAAAPRKVYFYGGSTLWGLGARDEYTIPSLVAKYLAEAGQAAQVVNCGQLGYVNTQELIDLMLQIQQNQAPDLAVFYDGINDTFAALQVAKAGIPKNEYHRVTEFNLLQRPGDFFKEYLMKTELFQQANIMASKYLKRQLVVKKSTKAAKDKYPQVAQEVVDVYLANVKMAAALMQTAPGPIRQAMFYWQPLIFYKKQLSPYEQEHHAGGNHYKDFFLLVDKTLQAKQADFKGYHFFDISRIMIDQPDSLFIDPFHVNEQGSAIIARRIAQDVAQVLRGGGS